MSTVQELPTAVGLPTDAPVAPPTVRSRDVLLRLRRNPGALVGAAIVALVVVLAVFAPLIAPETPSGQAYLDRLGGKLLSWAVGRLLVRARRPRPRRLLAHRLRRPRLARRRHRLGVAGVRRRRAARRGRRVLRRGDRLDDHAGRRRDARLPELPVRHRARRPPRSRAVAADRRHRHRQRADLRPPAARQHARRARSAYVSSARVLGLPSRRVLAVHMLPNAVSPLIVAATLALATAIIETAGLGFLGLGSNDPGQPEWGAMLANTIATCRPLRTSRSFPGPRSSSPCSGSTSSATVSARPSTRDSSEMSRC